MHIQSDSSILSDMSLLTRGCEVSDSCETVLQTAAVSGRVLVLQTRIDGHVCACKSHTVAEQRHQLQII
jgi:hypothetical protein